MTNNNTHAFAMLVTAIIILCLAYGAFIGVTSSIDGTNDHNNVTASSTSTAYSIVPIVVVIATILALVSSINFYVSSAERFQKINKKFSAVINFLNTTTTYFAFGLLAYAIFGTIAFGLYLSYRMLTAPGAGEASFTIIKYIATLIIFFFVTAGVGYIFKNKLWDKYKKRKEEQEHYKTQQELPGVSHD